MSTKKKNFVRNPKGLLAILAANRMKRQRTDDPSSPSPPWTELPLEITGEILHRLGAMKILDTAQRVCSSWFHKSKDPSMYRIIDLRCEVDDMPHNINGMCRAAVDRSQGQLAEIYLRYFPNDDDLDYIAQRAGNLKKLQLEKCYRLTGNGLVEAVKRFPLLEELHITLSNFTDETIEAVGLLCPLLRSFTFNTKATRYTVCDSDDEFLDYVTHMPRLRNEEAFAIARSMPGLRHLQVIVNGMTNEGLTHILDGCPHLESLDLRRCFNLDFTEDLPQQLLARIQCLRCPNDSIDDYKFEVDDEYISDLTPYSGPTWSEYGENELQHHHHHVFEE